MGDMLVISGYFFFHGSIIITIPLFWSPSSSRKHAAVCSLFYGGSLGESEID